MLVGDCRVLPLLERCGLGAVLKSVETRTGRVKVALLQLDSAAPAVASGSHFQNITYAGDGGGG